MHDMTGIEEDQYHWIRAEKGTKSVDWWSESEVIKHGDHNFAKGNARIMKAALGEARGRVKKKRCQEIEASERTEQVEKQSRQVEAQNMASTITEIGTPRLPTARKDEDITKKTQSPPARAKRPLRMQNRRLPRPDTDTEQSSAQNPTEDRRHDQGSHIKAKETEVVQEDTHHTAGDDADGGDKPCGPNTHHVAHDSGVANVRMAGTETKGPETNGGEDHESSSRDEAHFTKAKDTVAEQRDSTGTDDDEMMSPRSDRDSERAPTGETEQPSFVSCVSEGNEETAPGAPDEAANAEGQTIQSTGNEQGIEERMAQMKIDRSTDPEAQPASTPRQRAKSDDDVRLLRRPIGDPEDDCMKGHARRRWSLDRGSEGIRGTPPEKLLEIHRAGTDMEVERDRREERRIEKRKGAHNRPRHRTYDANKSGDHKGRSLPTHNEDRAGHAGGGKGARRWRAGRDGTGNRAHPRGGSNKGFCSGGARSGHGKGIRQDVTNTGKTRDNGNEQRPNTNSIHRRRRR